MHYIFALAIQLFLMFKTGTAGQVSKQDEYICFISIFLGVVSFDRQASINPVAEPFQNHSWHLQAEGSSHWDRCDQLILQLESSWSSSATKLMHTAWTAPTQSIRENDPSEMAAN